MDKLYQIKYDTKLLAKSYKTITDLTEISSVLFRENYIAEDLSQNSIRLPITVSGDSIIIHSSIIINNLLLENIQKQFVNLYSKLIFSSNNIKNRTVTFDLFYRLEDDIAIFDITDILYFDGIDLRKQNLKDRRKFLKQILFKNFQGDGLSLPDYIAPTFASLRYHSEPVDLQIVSGIYEDMLSRIFDGFSPSPRWEILTLRDLTSSYESKNNEDWIWIDLQDVSLYDLDLSLKPDIYY